MEFAKFYYTIQLATRSRAGLRPASELVSELDSVMEFGLYRPRILKRRRRIMAAKAKPSAVQGRILW